MTFILFFMTLKPYCTYDNIEFKTKSDYEDFCQLVKLSHTVELTDWEESYLARGTPAIESLPMVSHPNGQLVVGPELLAHVIDKKPGSVMQRFNPYTLWVDTSSSLLQNDLKFFDKSHRYVGSTHKSHFYQAKDQGKSDIWYGSYERIRMRHYGNTFSRPAHKEHELQELRKAIQPYYDYFKKGPGKDKLSDKYPKHLNTDPTKYADEAPISINSKDYRILTIVPAHVSISMLVQTLPFIKNPTKKKEIRAALKFALFCKLVYFKVENANKVTNLHSMYNVKRPKLRTDNWK